MTLKDAIMSSSASDSDKAKAVENMMKLVRQQSDMRTASNGKLDEHDAMRAREE